MKRFSRNFFFWLLSFTIIGAFSVTPVLAHDTGEDSSEHAVSTIASEYSDENMKHGKHTGWRDTEEKIRSITFTSLAKGSYVVINVKDMGK